MRVLLDTNVVLDVYLRRAPFVEASGALWLAHAQGRFEGYVAAITPVNLYYLARKIKGKEVAGDAVRELLRTFRVCPLDQQLLTQASDSPFGDYEDAVQVACAIASQLDAIVTRDLKDFEGVPLPVFSPVDLLRHLAA
jgi:predicted nucleic acid-binding protein